MKTSVLLWFLAGIALAVGGVGYLLNDGISSRMQQIRAFTQDSEPEKAEPQPTISGTKPNAPAPASEADEPKKPEFDLVRVEPSGETVVAGRSEPEASVALQANGKVIGKATASQTGEWVIIPDQPLAPGTHDLAVEATTKETTVNSDQRVAVAISGDRKTAPLIVRNTPGQASEILQKPRPSSGAMAKLEPAETSAGAAAGTPTAAGGKSQGGSVGPLANAEGEILQSGQAESRVAAKADGKSETAVPRAEGDIVQSGQADAEISATAQGTAPAPTASKTGLATAPAQSGEAETTTAANTGGSATTADAAKTVEAPPAGESQSPQVAGSADPKSADAPTQPGKGGSTATAQAGAAPASPVTVKPAEPATAPGQSESTVAVRSESAAPSDQAKPTVTVRSEGTEPPGQPSAQTPPAATTAPEPAKMASTDRSAAGNGVPAAPAADKPGAATVVVTNVETTGVTSKPSNNSSSVQVAVAPATGNRQETRVGPAPVGQPPAISSGTISQGDAANTTDTAAATPAAEDRKVDVNVDLTPSPRMPTQPVTRIVVGKLTDGRGTVESSGKAPPGSTVRLSLDGRKLDDVVADTEGIWRYEGSIDVLPGGHNIRVEQVGKDGEMVAALGETNFQHGLNSVVSVQAVETEKGKVYVAGTSTAGGIVRIYIDGRFIGQAAANPDGTWLLEANEQLNPGRYHVRADLLRDRSGTVIARAEVPFQRQADEVVLRPVTLTGEATGVGPQGDSTAGVVAPPRVVIIRKGDNLWTISRRDYGSGFRFSTIYLANQEQIKDPNLIYPGQVFTMPETDRSWTTDATNR